MIEQNEFVVFFGVFLDNCRIWATWAFSVVCVYMTAFKVGIPPLNHYFWWSRVQITLIKPLLCLNSVFFFFFFFPPSESNALAILLDSHMQIHIYIYTCIYMQNGSQRHKDKQTSENFFDKIYTSHFIVRVRKGYSRFYGERELKTEQNCNISTPHSYGRQRCLSCSPGLLNRRPRGSAFCWVLAFSTTSYQQLLWTPTQSGAPRAPSAWCGFPYHILSITLSDL